MCKFDLAWVGPCKEDPEKEMCSKHENLKCSCCGEPATRECPETFGMVCGELLCDNCEHYITEQGVNYAGNKHVKKSEFNNVPWYMKPIE